MVCDDEKVNGNHNAKEVIAYQLEKIGDSKENVKNLYLSLYEASNIILLEALGENRDKKMMVDIWKVAEYFGFTIEESEMHSNRNFFKSEVMGFNNISYLMDGSCRKTIYVNRELGDLSKRYVIAHEFARYIINNESNASNEYCVKMLFPGSCMEQLCDIMAAFLLMPIESVLLLMKEYLSQKKREGACPVHIEDCLRYLGYNLKVSDYHATVCYQHVRYLGGILRESKRCFPIDMDAYKEILC